MTYGEGTSEEVWMGRADVAGLATELWDTMLAASPFSATLLGDHRFDAEVPDPSAAAEAELLIDLEDLLERAETVGDEDLDLEDRATLSVLVSEARGLIAELRAGTSQFSASPLRGPQTALLQLATNLALTERWHADALVARYARVDRYLRAAADRLREGVALGRTPVASLVEQAVEQIEALLKIPPTESPLTAIAPPPGLDDRHLARWQTRLVDVVLEVVYPALGRYRDCLVDDVLPSARPDERAGLCWIDGGEELYAALVQRFTTLDRDAGTLHELGWEETRRLEQEYRELGERVLAVSDLGEMFERLRNDDQLRFGTSEEVLEYAQAALARAEAATPRWFGVVPETPCLVRPMNDEESEHGTIAYYVPPAVDGSRPGTYAVNTAHPQTRRRFEAEVLAFHEAVPGHHLQIALAQERADLPAIRRYSLITAYAEGWGLYVERLADEMGLYSDDLDRLGMLSFDSWRSGRLIVDTAVHLRGWSRQQAVDHLIAHSPQAENNVRNEVDRYIGRPGQALAYKAGQFELQSLRRRMEERLGDDFDIRAFHDAVLAPGPVTLDMLGAIVEAQLLGTRP
jgi:uncharacterized protein (DUF885 family)